MIRYIFEFEGHPGIHFDLDLSADTSDEAMLDTVEPWMELATHRCLCCPLPEGSRRTCPAAVAMLPVVHAFTDRVSHDRVNVTVLRDEVKITAQTSVQQAVRSLVGLLLALSRCPIVEKLRPMAHFHLPFGDMEHTVFRALGMFLTAQYLRQKMGLTPDWDLGGLLSLYEKIHDVNKGLANRIRLASTQDAAVNSLIILDAFGYEVETSIQDNLECLTPLFSMYLKEDPDSCTLPGNDLNPGTGPGRKA